MGQTRETRLEVVAELEETVTSTSTTSNTFSTTTTNTTGHCAEGFTYFSHTGKCYKYVAGYTAWTAAKEACQSDGGHLASVHDKETNDFLTTLTTVYTWIGGYQDDKDVWGWTDGSEWSYTNWRPGQPDNAYNGTQDFLAINLGLGNWDDGINDQSINRGYICQKDKTTKGR